MTLRTTSATRLTVVSKSSEVANTSATSRRSDSTGKRSGLEMAEPIAKYDSSRGPQFLIGQQQRGCGGGPRCACSKLFSGNNANVGEIAIFLGIVKPVADDKFVWDFEADVVSFQRKLSPRGLIEQRGNLQRARLVRHQQLLKNSQREAGVENIFDHDHVFIFHGLVDVLGQLYFASRIPSALEFLRRTGTVPVAGDADEIESGIEIDVPRQIEEKDRRAFQNADKNDRLPGKIFRDLRAQVGDPLGNFLARDQHLEFCHGRHIKLERM